MNEKKLARMIAEEYPEQAPEEETQSQGTLSPAVKKSLIFALMALFFYHMSYNYVLMYENAPFDEVDVSLTGPKNALFYRMA